ncbi:NAD-dependent epimerase/dehydratase family protein [Oleiharenicola sp. Vm1]|uniref:NAD-dependent epimerase/dehydratase family protein n=1 Tax=Oleiharenicola sp. Vm1 TaxID=3398393 RepID=UPI0039F58B7B
MSRVLVTGAAGFIGSHTVERLITEHHQVVGVDNFRTGRKANLKIASAHPNFRFFEGDILTPQWLLALIRDCEIDAIIHLAALVSVPESIAQPELNRRLNLDATRTIIDAASRVRSVRRIVFASSAAVYGDNRHLPLDEDAECVPLSPYGEAKLASERLIAECSRNRPDAAAISFRYFNVYGPRQDPSSSYSGVISRFADALQRRQQPMIHGDGEQTRDFIAVADVARANVLAATTPNASSGTFNLCTGRSTSLNLLLATMAAELKSSVQAVYGAGRAGDIRHSLGNPARAQRMLGFKTEHDLASGLRALFREK